MLALPGVIGSPGGIPLGHEPIVKDGDSFYIMCVERDYPFITGPSKGDNAHNGSINQTEEDDYCLQGIGKCKETGSPKRPTLDVRENPHDEVGASLAQYLTTLTVAGKS